MPVVVCHAHLVPLGTALMAWVESAHHNGNPTPLFGVLLQGPLGNSVSRGCCMHCRGRQIKDIAWFMIIMSVLLLFIGAGALLAVAFSPKAPTVSFKHTSRQLSTRS